VLFRSLLLLFALLFFDYYLLIFHPQNLIVNQKPRPTDHQYQILAWKEPRGDRKGATERALPLHHRKPRVSSDHYDPQRGRGRGNHKAATRGDCRKDPWETQTQRRSLPRAGSEGGGPLSPCQLWTRAEGGNYAGRPRGLPSGLWDPWGAGGCCLCLRLSSSGPCRGASKALASPCFWFWRPFFDRFSAWSVRQWLQGSS